MLQRLYIHNFRCFENFEITLKDTPSLLLIGKNGAGKSTLVDALEILQSIARGQNEVARLVQPKDFARGRSDVPIRFEIELLIEEKLYQYTLALTLKEFLPSKHFKKLCVFEEELSVEGNPIYSRTEAQIVLHDGPQNRESQFSLDRSLVALPIIQDQSETDPLFIFKTRLALAIVLSPIPKGMTGDAEGETMTPNRDGSNFSEWFTGLLSRYPAAYTSIEKYLKHVMPDLKDFLNEAVGKDAKSMKVRFSKQNADLSISFKDLSDGEKCFFLCAVVLAANEFYGPLLCFWDEPDHYLSLSEVGHFVAALRRSFVNKGQILVTSHNPEAIRKFSNENTLVLDRKSHLEPTSARFVSDLSIKGDLVDALIRGDIENEFE